MTDKLTFSGIKYQTHLGFYKKAEQFVCDGMEGRSIKLIEKLAFSIPKNFFAHFTQPQKLTDRSQKPRPYPKTSAAFVQIVPTWTPS